MGKKAAARDEKAARREAAAAARDGRRTEGSMDASSILSYGKLCDADSVAGTAGYATEGRPFHPRASVPGDLVLSKKHGNWSKEADFMRVKQCVNGIFGARGKNTAARAHVTLATRAVLGISSTTTTKGFRGCWSIEHVFCIMQLLERMRTAFAERDTINDVIIGCGKAAKRAVGRLLKVSLQRSDFDSEMLFFCKRRRPL